MGKDIGLMMLFRAHHKCFKTRNHRVIRELRRIKAPLQDPDCIGFTILKSSPIVWGPRSPSPYVERALVGSHGSGEVSS